eukprot:1949855-Rhodomonas_salina.2
MMLNTIPSHQIERLSCWAATQGHLLSQQSPGSSIAYVSTGHLLRLHSTLGEFQHGVLEIS